MSTEKKQRLVLSIIDFLNTSISDGTIKSDDKESLEVAVQCIGEAFEIDPSDSAQTSQLSIKPATLQSIFDVYLKTKDKAAGPSASSSSPSASTSSSSAPTAEQKAQADKLKAEGNSLMSAKKYDEAIAAYTEAIALDGKNPIYYSNRAAAHASKADFLSSIGDSEEALQVDPTFVKAYHRLGHAQYSLGDYQAAAEVFARGLALDPSNPGLKTGLENAEARISEQADRTATTSPTPRTPAPAAGGAGGMPDMSSMAEMMRNMGGGGAGGGGGGMPDLASLMSNPALMGMAQQMMANGGLDSIMRNPNVANMMNRVQSGDMPSMSEIMSDPSLRDLATQFGAGGAPGAGQ